MFKKREQNNYFKMLASMTGCSCDAARELDKILNQFDAGQMVEKMNYLHQIEQKGDSEKHAMMKKLVREFITPIDREDIIRLGNEIDNVTDAIEDVMLRLYMFHIQAIRPDALEFANVIVQCCDEMKHILEEFQDYKKSKTIYDSIIEVNRLEEVGDRLYIDTIRLLYGEESNPVTIAAWTEIYNRLERCCDSCEHVANVVESVIMKNS